MRLLRQTNLPLLLIAALLGAPMNALAAGGDQTQAAVELAYEGKERFEAGDYASALDRFEQARALAGSPVFDLYVARSLKALGRWREALVAYDAAAVHLVDGSNVSFVQAQDNAHKEREELAKKMPQLTVTAPHAPAATTPDLKIDAEAVEWPAIDLVVDPGKHVLAATLEHEVYDEVVTLSPGQALTIELPFGRPKAAADKDTAAPASDAGERRGLSPLAWTAFGIGAAGLLVGATTGTWAIVNMSSLNEQCRVECPTGNDEYDNLKSQTGTLATISDIGFIVAGAGALLGITFALTLNRGEKSAAKNASVALRPAGPGVVLSGSF